MPKNNAKLKLATEFFRGQRSGILSTHSVDVPGYPFGSLVPYCPLPDGRFAVLISGLAQHTQNINKNHKVALTISDKIDEVQAGRRLSIMADATLLTDLQEFVRARYLRFFPESEAYFSMHDFAFYVLSFVRARHIGGFGNIFWIEKEQWQSEFANWIEGETSAIEHMNQDHKDFLRKWGQHLKFACFEETELLAIDHEGFYIKAKAEQAFVAFKEKIQNPSDLRFAFKNLSLP